MSNATKIRNIAKVCHEANRAYCEALGDNSQVPWHEADSCLQDSAIRNVEFNIANPDAPASALHDNWLEAKQATGWTWGFVKDTAKKQHPDFVSYEELPVEQQKKDALFKAIVNALQ